MIHQQRVGCLSHAVTERAVGALCQRLPLYLCCRKIFWAHAEMKMMWC